MFTSLVVTKYTLPPLRPRCVAREALRARLLAGVERKLTLISAPAGFGKSTLALELAYLAAQRAVWRVAWLSLDRADNNPERWGAYLTAALARAGLPMGDYPESLLQVEGQPLLEALVIALINAVAHLDSPLLLVLDDYQAIEASEIHAAVALLLERMPPNFHVMIVTRTRPPLPLARLKVRGDLTEITAADLRLTAAEAAAFLHGTMGLDLPAAGVMALMDRTEGWIAGLQLAALSLQGSRDWAAAIESFGGRSPDVLEYLLGEVLAHQPADVRAFLLRTAILDRLTAPLCDALTGQSDGQATLHTLEQANLFVFPLDPERRWYRYHPLFADFLLARLRDTVGDAGLAELHVRAAHWYHRAGQLPAAIDALLLAGAFDQAADWIEDGFIDWSTQGALLTLRHWVDQLPQATFEHRPRLALLAAWVLVTNADVAADHRFTQTATYLDLAAGALKRAQAAGEEVGEHLGILAAVRTALAPWAPVRQCAMCVVHFVAHAERCAAEARERLPEQSLFWRSVVSGSLGAVYLRAGNVVGAAQAFGEAARQGARSGNLTAAVAALHRQGHLLTLLGRLGDALDAYREALRLAAQLGGEALPILAPIHLGMGMIYLQRNDLAGAGHCLSEARGRYQASGTEPPEMLLALARLAQVQGDAAAAQALLQQAGDALAAHSKLRAAGTAAWPEGVRVLLAAGDVAGARRWVEAGGAALAPEPNLGRASEYMALARVLIAEGEAGDALPCLRTLRQSLTASGCRGLEAEAWLIEALALQALGDAEAAAGCVRAALALIWSEGYVGLFAGSAPVLALLEQIGGELQRGRPADVPYRAFVGQLLALLAPPGAATELPPAPAAAAMAEPLTAREHDVLRLIAAGCSNQAIAAELYMGVSTVKWHLLNIYGKLQVRSRTQAVARAREVGLV